jgi:hypothetical protein
MKTSYSRRELYALGEPIGESSTYELAGRRVYGGGGGIVGDIVGGVSDAVSGVGDAVSDLYMDVRDPLEAAAVVAGNYFVPGSGLITSRLVSDEAQDMLGSGMGKLAMIGSGVGGGMEGNLSNWNPSNWGGAGGSPASWTSGAEIDPYEIFGSGASQWGGAGDYMDLGALSGTDLGGAGGSPASWTSGLSGFSGLGDAASKLLGGGSGSGGSGSGGLSLGGAALGAAGLAGLLKMMQSDSDKYGTPGRQDNVGPMAQFKYDPSKFTATRPDPAMFRPQGAPTAKIGYGGQGGGIGGMGGGMGGGQGGFDINQPILEQMRAQRPGMADMVEMGFAQGGGISTLGGYSDGGRLLKGPGDGMSDNIPAQIGRKQPARLADGEFVVPADVVSHLGNGSTDAGAKQLYKMMDRIRSARTGRKAQGKQIKADKFLPK